MVSIKEIQYQKDNSSNSQSRIITYESWDKYINNLQILDGFKDTLYPSLPRMTKLDNIIFKNNELMGEFFNRAMNIDVIHIAYLV